MEAKYTFATMVCLVLVLQHGYGASLGGPKTLKCNILRVFTMSNFCFEDPDSIRTATFRSCSL